MTAITAQTAAAPPSELVRTARIAGLWHLSVGIAGVLRFIVEPSGASQRRSP
jgi:hypothetical protein